MLLSEGLTGAVPTRAGNMVIKGMDFCVRWPKFESWLYRLLTMRLRVSHLISGSQFLSNRDNNSMLVSLMEAAAIWSWSMGKELTCRKDEGKKKRNTREKKDARWLTWQEYTTMYRLLFGGNLGKCFFFFPSFFYTQKIYYDQHALLF